MLHLLALKLRFPDTVHLLRGNHECRSVTGYFGFKDECRRKYGVSVYNRFLLCFEALPIAAVIGTAYGRFLCMHGGLSPTLVDLEQLDKVDRFQEPGMAGLLCDVLWSDPIKDEDVGVLPEAELGDFLAVDWTPNPVRGCSFYYGFDSMTRFLDANGLNTIVRAHEVQEAGFYKHFDPERLAGADDRLRREWPPVLTIFSAPNYCDRYNNRGAFLRVGRTEDAFEIVQFDAVDHPAPTVIAVSQAEENQAQIERTLPYMPITFRAFVQAALELGHSSASVVGSVAGESASGASSGASSGGEIGESEDEAQQDPADARKSLPIKRGAVQALVERFGGGGGAPPTRRSSTGGALPVAKPRRRRSSAGIRLAGAPAPSLYEQAAHSDNLNEMHPNMVALRMDKVRQSLAEGEPEAPAAAAAAAAAAAPVGRARAASSPQRPRMSRRASLTDLTRAAAAPASGGEDLAALAAAAVAAVAAEAAAVSDDSAIGDSDSDDESQMSDDSFYPPASSDDDDDDDDSSSASEGDGDDAGLQVGETWFSGEELVCLKLLFAILDRNGNNLVDEEELAAYAEDCGDYAQRSEAQACVEAVDADGDGAIGLMDYLVFASKMKLHMTAQRHKEVMGQLALGFGSG